MISVNLGDSMAYLCRLKDADDQEDTLCIPLQQRQHKCWMMKEKERILRLGSLYELEDGNILSGKSYI
jgi:serine/threonine protein phosphatase PrpC